MKESIKAWGAFLDESVSVTVEESLAGKPVIREYVYK